MSYSKYPSAFKAVSSQDQSVKANQATKVTYSKLKFDLDDEYSTRRSMFIPREDGVYLVNGTISFEPVSYRHNYRVRVDIRVNGKPYEAADNDFWGVGVQVENVVQVSSILKLYEGDKVEIFMESSISGKIKANEPGENTTSFEAARISKI